MFQPANRERVKIVVVALLVLSSSFAGIIFSNEGGPGRSAVFLSPDGLEPVSFSPSGSYNVSFIETGLPAGTEWFVNLTNGQSFPSTSSSLSFAEPNGTYYYSISTSYKSYRPTPSSSFFTINGNSQNLYVSFSIVTYSVIFTESGLPLNTKWFVNLSNGQTFDGTSTAISFVESNGTYFFTVSVTNKIYSPSPASGQFIVSGQPATESISFTKVLYRVEFSETGLPSNVTWYVNQTGGSLVSSSNSTITLYLSNGTYSFSISTTDSEYYPSPETLTLRVNGQGLLETVTFTLFTSIVSFSESGLPSGTRWFVNVTGPIVKQISSMSSLISFNAPNGTYNYTVTEVSEIYGPHLQTGNFTVSGNPVSVSVLFVRFYNVTFYEQGLPNGIPWYVNLTDPESFKSTSTTLIFMEPNGTYHYIIGVGNSTFLPDGQTGTGNFTISGSSITPAPQASPIIFYALHKVTFAETRLPFGTLWYLNISSLNGTLVGSYESVQSSITFSEINGTYRYHVSTADNQYRPSTSSGLFTVKGWPLAISEVAVSITFYLVTYNVIFTESGLTYGTPWSVTLNNSTRQSLNDTVIFAESNGTYSYIIDALSGFTTSDYVGNLTVNGSAVSETVIWKEVTYQLEIVQTGIPQGTKWSATLQGKTFNGVDITLKQNSTGGDILFTVPNGTYNYTITPPLGYSGTHTTGAVLIQGQSATAAAFLRAPNYFLIAMVLGVIMAGLVIALYVMIRRDNRSMFQRDPKHVKKEGLFFLRKRE